MLVALWCLRRPQFSTLQQLRITQSFRLPIHHNLLQQGFLSSARQIAAYCVATERSNFLRLEYLPRVISTFLASDKPSRHIPPRLESLLQVVQEKIGERLECTPPIASTLPSEWALFGFETSHSLVTNISNSIGSTTARWPRSVHTPRRLGSSKGQHSRAPHRSTDFPHGFCI